MLDLAFFPCPYQLQQFIRYKDTNEIVKGDHFDLSSNNNWIMYQLKTEFNNDTTGNISSSKQKKFTCLISEIPLKFILKMALARFSLSMISASRQLENL